MPPRWTGRSLSAIACKAASENPDEAPVYRRIHGCEGCIAPLFMIRQGNWKLITASRHRSGPAVFDLAA
jgi:hypothetical protein